MAKKKQLKAKIKLYYGNCRREVTAMKGKLVSCCKMPMKVKK